MRRPILIGTLYLLGFLALMGNCTNDLGPNACEEPGVNEKCSCEDGRGSLRTCDAFGQWGPCYCDTPVCGDGDLDQGEECDDGNNADGDGCTADCISEDGGPGGFGGGGPTTSTGGSSSSGGVGGVGGVGGSGGAGAAGGSGNAGGLGGAGGN